MSDDTIYVRTVPDIEGRRYHAEISQGEDTVLTLTPDQAVQWAGAVHAAVAAAEYDAAVYRQLDSFLPGNVDERDQVIMQVITDLRGDRPAQYFVGPVSAQPVVNTSIEPRVTMFVNGLPTGQWTVDLAREHASQCLEVAQVVKLDTDYLRVLTGVIGLDVGRGMAMINDLGQYRQ